MAHSKSDTHTQIIDPEQKQSDWDGANIQSRIFTVRSLQVMLDSDLAHLYRVETKVFNQAVKRNIARFPERFRFQLTEDEFQNLRSQIVTSSEHGGRRYLPYAFTEHGVSMLSAVLNSDRAIETSIKIIDSFVNMRKFISSNSLIFQKFDAIEQKLLKHDDNFNKIFDAIESGDAKPAQGIFYDGQMFDAYVFVCDLVKSAKKSIVLIDNYIDESILTLLSKRDTKCTATIYTKTITKALELDLAKHNTQYPNIEVRQFELSHDRFLLIDDEVYHIGASLKDLGKKWFAFSRMDKSSFEIMGKLG